MGPLFSLMWDSFINVTSPFPLDLGLHMKDVPSKVSKITMEHRCSLFSAYLLMWETFYENDIAINHVIWY